MRKAQLVLAGVSLTSFVTGAVAGYFYAKKSLEQHYMDMANDEIKDAKDYYESQVDRPLAGERIYYNAVKLYQGSDEPDIQPVDEGARVQRVATDVIRNIFREPGGEQDEPDYSEEMATRSPDAPYIISAEEYLGNDSNYAQETVTYYLGDQVLADDRDEVIDEFEATIGLANLRFGHRSNDDNVVYVRNERLLIDFEVLRSERKYVQDVLGLDEVEVT